MNFSEPAASIFRRIRLTVLFAGLLLTSCAEGTTAIRLEVRFDETLNLSNLEVHSEMVTRLLPATREVLLLVPDGWAGNEVEIRVDGLRSAQRIASGRVSVSPIAGAEVGAVVTLAAVACGAWCTPGSTACDRGGVETCVEDELGCPDWGPRVPCEDALPFCSIGRCAADCIDECVMGERRCAGPAGVEVCGFEDSDECLEWLRVEECSTGVCSAGECVEVCADECEEGTVTCRDGGLSTCGDRTGDGCLEWGPSEPCAEEESCSEGVCRALEDCTDECIQDACTPDGRLGVCGNFDLDECLELSSGTSCDTENPCVLGRCSDGACVTAPAVCETPPEFDCIDGDTLRVFDTNGICTAGGVCDYQSREVACPNCPACDVCAGVECTNTENSCLAPTGVCDGSDGQCSFEEVSGGCDDGNACTLDDTCQSGVCLGTPMRCDAPPPRCEGSDLVTSMTGECSAGACVYPVDTIEPCPNGCAAGACQIAECPNTCSAELFEARMTYTMAEDESHVYWADMFGLMRRDKTASAIETLDPADGIEDVAFDDSHVYWVNITGVVSRRAKDGGTVQVLERDETGASAIAVDDTHVYWTNGLSSNVRRTPKIGGATELVATGQGTPTAIAVDADFVYWLDSSGGFVRRWAKVQPLQMVTTLAAGQGAPNDLVLDEQHIYWTNFAGNQVMRAPKVSGVPAVFAMDQEEAFGIAVDANYVYWTTLAAGEVIRKAKVAGTVQTLFADSTMPAREIAVDDTHIYWSTQSEIWRVLACGCGP